MRQCLTPGPPAREEPVTVAGPHRNRTGFLSCTAWLRAPVCQNAHVRWGGGHGVGAARLPAPRPALRAPGLTGGVWKESGRNGERTSVTKAFDKSGWHLMAIHHPQGRVGGDPSCWQGRQDSNLRPTVLETVALTG